MAIGVVDDSEFEKELDSYNPSKSIHKDPTPSVNTDVPIIIDIPTRGRKDGDNNVPESLRKIIGETAVIDGRQEAIALADMFGISKSSVSAYANGATSTTSYDKPKSSIIDHINKSRRRSIKKAQSTLDLALGSISQDKLDYTDAKDLSAIAKDMSVIIKNLEPDKNTEVTDGKVTPQYVIYAPQFRDERSFDTINVMEEA